MVKKERKYGAKKSAPEKKRRKERLKKIMTSKEGNPDGWCKDINDPGNFDLVIRQKSRRAKDIEKMTVFEGESV